jgi:hypothetical protein
MNWKQATEKGTTYHWTRYGDYILRVYEFEDTGIVWSAAKNTDVKKSDTAGSVDSAKEKAIAWAEKNP